MNKFILICIGLLAIAYVCEGKDTGTKYIWKKDKTHTLEKTSDTEWTEKIKSKTVKWIEDDEDKDQDNPVLKSKDGKQWAKVKGDNTFIKGKKKDEVVEKIEGDDVTLVRSKKGLKYTWNDDPEKHTLVKTSDTEWTETNKGKKTIWVEDTDEENNLILKSKDGKWARVKDDNTFIKGKKKADVEKDDATGDDVTKDESGVNTPGGGTSPPGENTKFTWVKDETHTIEKADNGEWIETVKNKKIKWIEDEPDENGNPVLKSKDGKKWVTLKDNKYIVGTSRKVVLKKKQGDAIQSA